VISGRHLLGEIDHHARLFPGCIVRILPPIIAAPDPSGIAAKSCARRRLPPVRREHLLAIAIGSDEAVHAPAERRKALRELHLTARRV
jgi:hypothetical protein